MNIKRIAEENVVIARYEIRLDGQAVATTFTLAHAREKATAGHEVIDRYARIEEPERWFIENDGSWTTLRTKHARGS
jgi:hypothetical protein